MKKYRSSARALTTEFTVTGRNVTPLINRLARAGIPVWDARCVQNGVLVTIPSSDCKKLFAICDEMCYNILSDVRRPPRTMRKNRITVAKKAEKGFFRLPYQLLRRAGLLAGAAFFTVAASLAGGRILGYSLENVPAESRSGVMRSLQDGGAALRAKFSALDARALADAIVRENADVSFATVYKRGSYLVVETLAARQGAERAKAEDLLSPVDGTVEKIAVLRGTPLVEAGAAVREGQPLVGAYFHAGESVIRTAPMAEITLRAEFVFVFNASEDSAYFHAAAVAVAKDKCPETHVIGQKTESTEKDGGYVITVTLVYLKYIGE